MYLKILRICLIGCEGWSWRYTYNLVNFTVQVQILHVEVTHLYVLLMLLHVSGSLLYGSGARVWLCASLVA